MAVHEVESYVRQATRKIQAEYERISARAREDPGTAGDEGELNWAEVLRQWLPSSVHVVTKGRILCADGTTSHQVDVVILSENYPAGLLENKMYLASEVLAIFECKLTLKKKHVIDTVERAAKLKRLLYKQNGRDIVYGLLSHSHSWQSKETATERISTLLKEADANHVEHPNEALDLTCVADLATWVSICMSPFGEGEDEFTSGYYRSHSKESRVVDYFDSDSPPTGRMISTLYQQLAAGDKRFMGMSLYFARVGMRGSLICDNAREWHRDEVFRVRNNVRTVM
ncbi:DUF6602 domain-containing protein [Streptomyces albidoflavus]|uniref:DUF6602 domain-containing protein n=1 Tax=Streptomyces albidoflavus TaxID=1886 RepID=UPI00101E5CCA|nr:DUF6602 domain-containing protein [Streptomyces albidoflavus]